MSNYVIPELKDKVIMITGSAQGIGNAIAHKFSEQGAKIVIIDIDQAMAETAVAEIKNKGGQAVAKVCDVTDFELVGKTCSEVHESLGSIDVLINNAGIIKDGLFIRMKPEQWHKIIDIHLNGTYNFSFHAAQYMRKAKSGNIINISSIAAEGNPGQANYSSAKAGIIGLTGALGRELVAFGIRVNCIKPGLIDTKILSSMPEKKVEELIKMVPMGRAGNVNEIANTALFLASDLSSYITAEVIKVSGGF